jgi:hypothetical protein
MPTLSPPKHCLSILAAALYLLCAGAAHAATKSARGDSSLIEQGAFRIDLNGKVRDLCVNEVSIPEISAKGWRERLSEQGVRCELSNLRREKNQTSWTGMCSSPGMGRVFRTRHDVLVKVIDENNFEILTLMSGDLKARIPVRATRLNENKSQCDSRHDTFRAWQ